MPIKPKTGEEKDTFISRCISKERSLGKRQDQSIAICISAWKNRNK